MNKIKILPDHLANQIAAGEVVERPSSVIKELIENSIDAGAENISVEIELGGRRLMRVTDDGSGMNRDDAILAFERHATSKISSLEDLARIGTLGFRGEALASIASVSKVELISKTSDETAGTRVYIEGGKLIDVKDIGRPTGTTFAARDLFFNTPARRKFMRSEATENYHITSIITHYALAKPNVSFSFTNNGRESFRFSKAKDLRERAYQIFGAEMLESLLPVEGGREHVARISGYISAPRERRTTRDGQYFFINGRFVKDKIIAGGLLEGYRSILPHGVYPVAFLFLDVPLEELDVNVHPAKTEVRFRRSQAVKDVIAEAVREGLKRGGIVGQRSRAIEVEDDSPGERTIEEDSIEEIAPSQARIEFSLDREYSKEPDLESSSYPADREHKEVAPDRLVTPLEPDQDAYSGGSEVSDRNYQQNDEMPVLFHQARVARTSQLPPFDSASGIPKSVEIADLTLGRIRPIGQLHESFIIAVDDEGLLLIDQHVAHERILFDKFKQRETGRSIESQNLLLPETIDLTPSQAAAFGLVEEELEKCGFALMRLSGRTIAIKAVPTDLPPAELRNLFSEILETAESEKRGNAKRTMRDNIAASLACKAAVKINMKLTPEKMQWMIDKLLTTSSPTTCPHGRPVILRLSMKDIERKFHRT